MLGRYEIGAVTNGNAFVIPWTMKNAILAAVRQGVIIAPMTNSFYL
jgi:hypothetical protein